MKKFFHIVYALIALIGLIALVVLSQTNDKTRTQIETPVKSLPISKPNESGAAIKPTDADSNSKIDLTIKTEPYVLDCEALRADNEKLHVHLEDLFFQCMDVCLSTPGCDASLLCHRIVDKELEDETNDCVNEALSNS